MVAVAARTGAVAVALPVRVGLAALGSGHIDHWGATLKTFIDLARQALPGVPFYRPKIALFVRRRR